MDTLRQDLAYAARRLRQAPGFTLIAVATLALGIGANSAIFSVVNAVLLRPLPFPEPERLVRLGHAWKGRPTSVYSPQNFVDMAAQAGSFESVAAIDAGGVTLTGRGAPARIEGAEVSASFFDLLRLRPAHGRGFAPDENETGKTKVVVVGDRVWRERLAADPAVIGQTLMLNRQPHTIVGIAPPGFTFPEQTELWTPLEYTPQFLTQSRGAWYLSAIGRLKPGVSVDQAREEASGIAARLAQAYPNHNEGVGAHVDPLQEAMVGKSRRALLVLLGAVGLVLLIACVNVANLILARTAARETELAVRMALGAGRGRVVRQLLTESVLLALLGGAAGVALASVSLDALLGLQPEGVPRLAEVRVDRVVLGFAAGLSLLTGLLFGFVPALSMARRAAAQSLREGGRGIVGARGQRLRGGLVIGQMALAMMLLAGAGLLIRSFVQLRRVDPGFPTASGLTFRISLPDSAYEEEERRIAFYDALLPRLKALPGVRAVGAVAGVPLGGSRFSISFVVEGRPEIPPAQQPSMEVRIASADYLAAMGIPVLRGRGFDHRDIMSAPQVVVLSESAVRRFFPNEDPIGKRIRLGLGRAEGKPKPGGEIVGIVADVRERGLDKEVQPEIYVPYAQYPLSSMDVLLRTAVPPRSMLPAAAKVVAGLDPELPLARPRTLDEIVARSISEPRFYMVLLGAFAGTALFLAALGIFGVMSYAVVQRSREIGIRVALGAHPAAVLRMVLGHALVLAVVGVAAGLVGALATSRALAGLLFELSPTDPVTLVAVAALLTGVALLASYLPARRATRVDPLIALRAE